MKKISEILAEIISDMQTQNSPLRRSDESFGLISIGDRMSAFVNSSVEGKIRNIARRLHDNHKEIRQAHTLNEWHAIVRNAIGRSLPHNRITSDCLEAEASRLKKRMNKQIKEHTADYGELVAVFGCWLFKPPSKSPIEIGPVCFEDKEIWMERFLRNGVISKEEQYQNFQEAIQCQVAGAPMVCEVKTHGLAPGLAFKQSRLAAYLALTSISLIWDVPSRKLDRFEISPNGKSCITHDFLYSSEHQKVHSWRSTAQHYGFDIRSEPWDEYYKEKSCFLRIAGQMIEYWTSIARYNDASPLLKSLSHSLYFFWKACSEDSDVMSIVEFITVLEFLVNKQGQDEILELICAQLSIGREHEIIQGKTMAQVIDCAYRDARSRNLHGSMDLRAKEFYLRQDWSDMRSLLELLASTCLRNSMIMSQDKWEGKEVGYLLRAC